MVVVRVLQRKDAASLVVAIAAGLVVANFISSVSSHLAAVLSGVEADATFADDYWHPFVSLVLQLVALELLTRLAIAVRGAVDGGK